MHPEEVDHVMWDPSSFLSDVLDCQGLPKAMPGPWEMFCHIGWDKGSCMPSAPI